MPSNEESDIDLDAVDISKYMEEAQPYIMKAIQDPSKLAAWELQEVANCIVNRAWQDPGYHTTAANLCQYIAEKERIIQDDMEIPQLSFRKGVINSCKQISDDWTSLRNDSLEYWLAYVQFCVDLYREMSVKGQKLKGMGLVVLNVLTVLTSQPSINQEEEVSLLSQVFQEVWQSIFTEHDSERTYGVVNNIRDGFLEPETSTEIRTKLLPLIQAHGLVIAQSS